MLCTPVWSWLVSNSPLSSLVRSTWLALMWAQWLHLTLATISGAVNRSKQSSRVQLSICQFARISMDAQYSERSYFWGSKLESEPCYPCTTKGALFLSKLCVNSDIQRRAGTTNIIAFESKGCQRIQPSESCISFNEQTVTESILKQGWHTILALRDSGSDISLKYWNTVENCTHKELLFIRKVKQYRSRCL